MDEVGPRVADRVSEDAEVVVETGDTVVEPLDVGSNVGIGLIVDEIVADTIAGYVGYIGTEVVLRKVSPVVVLFVGATGITGVGGIVTVRVEVLEVVTEMVLPTL